MVFVFRPLGIERCAGDAGVTTERPADAFKGTDDSTALIKSYWNGFRVFLCVCVFQFRMILSSTVIVAVQI